MHQSNDFLESRYFPKNQPLSNNFQDNIVTPKIRGAQKSFTKTTNIHEINANLEFNLSKLREENDLMENQSLVSGMDSLLNEEGQFVHANFKE